MILGMLAIYLFSGKGSEPKVEISHNMVLEKIEDLGNLEVVKFTIQDIMEYEKVRRWLPNAKTALIISGEVTGCIDLRKVKPEDIYTSGDSIRLTLPAPEICHVYVDHSKSRVYNMQYSLWETPKIVDDAYRHAEHELKDKAAKMDIESKSRDNTVNLMTPILQAMGFKQVGITFKPKETAR